MDEDKVQIDATSEDGVESKEHLEGDTQTQPLTEEVLTQRVNDAVAKAIAAQIETANRQIQSIKDKSKAEVEAASRRAKQSERTLTHVKGALKDADPDTLKEFELAELRSMVAGHQGMEQDEKSRREQAEFESKFQGSVTHHLNELGIDSNDKRIDWGSDASNYLDKRERIDASIRQIIKQNATDAEAALDNKLKDEMAKMRKELGLDSVDTANPTGAGGKSEEAVLKEMYPTMYK